MSALLRDEWPTRCKLATTQAVAGLNVSATPFMQ